MLWASRGSFSLSFKACYCFWLVSPSSRRNMYGRTSYCRNCVSGFLPSAAGLKRPGGEPAPGSSGLLRRGLTTRRIDARAIPRPSSSAALRTVESQLSVIPVTVRQTEMNHDEDVRRMAAGEEEVVNKRSIAAATNTEAPQGPRLNAAISPPILLSVLPPRVLPGFRIFVSQITQLNDMLRV